MPLVSTPARGKKFAGEQMKKVRQAVNYAIDREGIAKARLASGSARQITTCSPSGQIGYDESLPKYHLRRRQGEAAHERGRLRQRHRDDLDYILAA